MSEGDKEISKRAADKAKKKAEKLAKKREYSSQKSGKVDQDSPQLAERTETSKFNEGWLKRVFEEKPVDVITRFPPEPNGYLHIGHAKAIMVNFGFAEYHKGKCVLRLDDTNPTTEDECFVESIKDIVTWLGYTPCSITYSSDYFDRLYKEAENLILKGKAYVCHCSKEEVNLQRGGPDNRGPRYACSHRNRPLEESLNEFRAMRDGNRKAKEAHLRMKQSIDDPLEGNPQMWDIAAYRVVDDNHHYRTGSKWKIYPTYDFTHCLCDAYENISHSLCTTEFFLSRTSYDWLLEQLDYKIPNSTTKGPIQREYGRLNINGAILSKRRILMLVNGCEIESKLTDGSIEIKKIPKAVRGWDDPRLFTMVAIKRRGVPAGALKSFVSELGVTDALTSIQVSRFDTAIRKYLERTVPRIMLVVEPILVTIQNLPHDYDDVISIPYDPKNPSGLSRNVHITRDIYIEDSDFRVKEDANFYRLSLNGTVGLLNVPFFIKAVSFVKDEKTGKVSQIIAEKVESVNVNSNSESLKLPKVYIHWVSSKYSVPVVTRFYEQLFLSNDPNGLDWKNGGYVRDLNPNSERIFTESVTEEAIFELERLKKSKNRVDGSNDHGSSSIDESIRGIDTIELNGKNEDLDDIVRFQAIRTGYFCIDKDKVPDGRVVLNQIVALKEDTTKNRVIV